MVMEMVAKTNKKKWKSSSAFSIPFALNEGKMTMYWSKYWVSATIKRFGNLISLRNAKI